MRLPALVLAALALAASASASERAAPTQREMRCLAMVAYAEAAVDGVPGMTAVIHVIRNRVRDAGFPDDACAVIAEPGQFQPVTESPILRRVARDPEAYRIPDMLGIRSPAARALLRTAHRLAAAPARVDSTGGALYFVNPDLMDPTRCPWFAALRRTARIGGHVFMIPYAQGEPRGEPALDCGAAGDGRVAAAAGG